MKKLLIKIHTLQYLRVFVLIILVHISNITVGQDLRKFETVLIRINKPDKNLIEQINNVPGKIITTAPNNYIEFLTTRLQYEKLREENINIDFLFAISDLKKNLVKKDSEKNIEGYYTYEIMKAELENLSNTYSSICKLEDIGDTRGKQYLSQGHSAYTDYNHDIWALKISDNVNIEEDEPGVYFNGGIHSNELVGVEVTMAILKHLLENYSTNTEIKEYVDNTEIWFVPMINPNGHKIVINEINLLFRNNFRDTYSNNKIDAQAEYWIIDNDALTCIGNEEIDEELLSDLFQLKDISFSNKTDLINAITSLDNYPDDPNLVILEKILSCTIHVFIDDEEMDGFDLNRNYEWIDEETNLYAFSEPETQAMIKLTEDNHFVTGISYHSALGRVLKLYSINDVSIPPDKLVYNAIGQGLANSIPAVIDNNLDFYNYDYLYDAAGTTNDYNYCKQGIFEYIIELEPNGEFIPTVANKELICQANIPSAMLLLNRLTHSMLSGLITDQNTGEPIKAEVFIDGIDNTGEYRDPMTSNITFGRYYRLLLPGTYNVTFSADTYREQTQQVTITDDAVTYADILLEHETAFSANLNFTITKTKPTDATNTEYRFEAISNPAPVSYSWSFGGTEQIETYTLNSSQKTITLTAVYEDNSEKTIERQITTCGYNNN